MKEKAARLFEKAKKFDLAIQHYKETESYPELMTLYEKAMNFFDAFKIAFKIKDRALAEEYAGRIPKNDSNYLHAHIYLMIDHWKIKSSPKFWKFFKNASQTHRSSSATRH
ncbi:MAG: hypothetical protein R2877_08610 [Bdellovibrionota bacterium]